MVPVNGSDLMVRLRTRIARRKYMHKKVYAYEIYYLEFPRKLRDQLKHFVGRDLRIGFDVTDEKLVVTIEPMQNVSPVKNGPVKNTGA